MGMKLMIMEMQLLMLSNKMHLKLVILRNAQVSLKKRPLLLSQRWRSRA
jgi:hypothetical protein